MVIVWCVLSCFDCYWNWLLSGFVLIGGLFAWLLLTLVLLAVVWFVRLLVVVCFGMLCFGWYFVGCFSLVLGLVLVICV